ncbi:phosphotransferase [Demequina sp.]|uniref:phosphotransferase n=1 Tax=Demequina sp. TaxID=2050685 RepID=UPI003D14F5A3
MGGNDGRLAPSDDQVAAMVFGQMPALAGRDIGRRYTMHDHVTVRIGDDYGVLMPTVPGKDYLYERVSDLLEPLLPTWTFPYSAPIATGEPDNGFPYHWTLVRWLSGSTAAFVPLHDESAVTLGDALRQIHGAPIGTDAPDSPITAPTLRSLEPEWTRLLEATTASGAPENRVLDAAKANAMWQAAADTPVDARTWTHGNLEPRAVLSDRGAFVGILIWHNFGGGDPAADVGYATNLFSSTQLSGFLDAYGEQSAQTAQRVRGWQLLGALRLIELGDPFLVRIAWERLIELDLVSEA